MWGTSAVAGGTLGNRVGNLGRVVGLVTALLCGGCAIMPTSGPSEVSVKLGYTNEGPDYGLVKLTPATLGVLGEFGPKVLSGYFPDRRPPQTIRFGIGDVVSVTIFEAAAGGLFIPAEAGVRPGNFRRAAQSERRLGREHHRSLWRRYSRRGPHTVRGSAGHRRVDPQSRDRSAGCGRSCRPADIADQRARRSECPGTPAGQRRGRAHSRRHHPRRRHQGPRL